MSANDRQVGGSHYAAVLQHWDLIAQFNVPYHEGNATKYLSRASKKGGAQDLEKALHYTEKLIELYRAGVRQPNPTPPGVDSIIRFASEYELIGEECDCFTILLRWRNQNDLLCAVELLRGLIDDYVSE